MGDNGRDTCLFRERVIKHKPLKITIVFLDKGKPNQAENHNVKCLDTEVPL